ncbi:hypothetical protein GN958_ATG13443 [Phytophthora infestans]|uniref:Alpha-carbonic anhydrase domain-containing protein n=1 Tax=Phytophthora infestans TaxID=4787 RepID=A0A8S9U977_PHYIN|nr:hypothetical protein GN958_ATG13443 [Phytophthora infestans]
MAQIHLHAPSEHTLVGRRRGPLRSHKCALTVVSVFLDVVTSGTTVAFLVSFLDGMENVSPTRWEPMSLGSFPKVVITIGNRLPEAYL